MAGLSSYELGCLALEQGVLMERAGFAIWVSGTYILDNVVFVLDINIKGMSNTLFVRRQCHCSWWWYGKW